MTTLGNGRIWYLEGCPQVKDPIMQKMLGRLIKVYAKYDMNLYITSTSAGMHTAASFHPIGKAVDILHHRVPEVEIRKAVGQGFDIIYHTDDGHCHIEHDIWKHKTSWT